MKLKETSKSRGSAITRQFNVINQRPPIEGLLDNTIDPRTPDEEGTTGPIENLVDLPVDHQEPSRVLKIIKNLPDRVREAIFDFLGQNLDVLTWLTQTWKESTPAS